MYKRQAIIVPSTQIVPEVVASPITQPVVQPITEPVVEPTAPPVPTYPTTTLPSLIPRPIMGLTLFPEYLPPRKKKKTTKRKAGYEILVRKKGKYRPLSPYAYPKEEAIAIGAKEVLGTARATFKITPSLKPVRDTGRRISPQTIQQFFRAPKSQEPGVFVQRETRRITSPGEKREITRVGIATRIARQAFGITKRNTSSKGLSLSTPKSTKSKFKFI